MVTDEERDYMYRVYAQDPQARINLGIRRRLAPLLGNNRRRIELMNMLLFSLPGTPVLYYGDEIGMGDNIYLGDRNGVRTPMQWSSDRNAGFSRANPQRLYLPIIIDPEYHYEAVNVETQQNNPHSLLWWMKRMIALRKQYKAFGRGSIEFLLPENTKVLAFLRCHQEECILVVCNLSRFVQYVELDLSARQGLVPTEVFAQTAFPAIGEHPYMLTLGPHSTYWFSLEEPPPAEIQLSPREAQIPYFFFNRPGGGTFPEQKPAESGGLAPPLSHQMPLVRRQGPEYQSRHHNRGDSLPLRCVGGLLHPGQSGVRGRGAGNLCPAPGRSFWGTGFPGAGGISPGRGGPPPGSGPGGPAL